MVDLMALLFNGCQEGPPAARKWGAVFLLTAHLGLLGLVRVSSPMQGLYGSISLYEGLK